MDNPPTEIRRAKLEIVPGLELEFVLLDDGRSLLTVESMERFMQWLADDPAGKVVAIDLEKYEI